MKEKIIKVKNKDPKGRKSAKALRGVGVQKSGKPKGWNAAES